MQVSRHAKCQASLRGLGSEHGSSACPLISARMILASLFFKFTPRIVDDFVEKVTKTVRHFDKMVEVKKINGGLLVVECMQQTALTTGCNIEMPVKACYLSKMTLSMMVKDYKAPFSVIFNGVPLGADYSVHDWVGNAFCMNVTEGCGFDFMGAFSLFIIQSASAHSVGPGAALMLCDVCLRIGFSPDIKKSLNRASVRPKSTPDLAKGPANLNAFSLMCK